MFHIYDEPPQPEFWLLWLLTDGDVAKHAQMYDLPLMWLYAYADKKIFEINQRAKKNGN